MVMLLAGGAHRRHEGANAIGFGTAVQLRDVEPDLARDVGDLGGRVVGEHPDLARAPAREHRTRFGRTPMPRPAGEDDSQIGGARRVGVLGVDGAREAADLHLDHYFRLVVRRGTPTSARVAAAGSPADESTEPTSTASAPDAA